MKYYTALFLSQILSFFATKNKLNDGLTVLCIGYYKNTKYQQGSEIKSVLLVCIL